MITISSKTTIALKILIPAFLFVFLGGITIVTWFNPKLQGNKELISPELLTTIRILFTSTFLTLIGLWYVLFSKLNRIDVDDESIYVSNYFKTYRYGYDAVEYIKTDKGGIYRSGLLMFKLTTSIGKQAKFIVNNHKYITAIERHTPLAGLIKEGSD